MSQDYFAHLADSGRGGRHSRNPAVLLGLVVLALLIVVSAVAILSQSGQGGSPGLVASLFPVYILGFIVLLIRLRRSDQPGAERAMVDDHRAPVLYLRPFTNEESGSPANPEEVVVAFAARPVGPLVAVGRPEDRLPPFGARRVYSDEEGRDWREVVADYLDRAALVVVSAGSSEGLRWEIERVVSSVQPEKVIVLPDFRAQYPAFTGLNYSWGASAHGTAGPKYAVGLFADNPVMPEVLTRLFPKPFPSTPGAVRAYWFDADWTSHADGESSVPGDGSARARFLSRFTATPGEIGRLASADRDEDRSMSAAQVVALMGGAVSRPAGGDHTARD